MGEMQQAGLGFLESSDTAGKLLSYGIHNMLVTH